MKSEQNRSSLWIGILISVLCLAALFFFIDPRDIWQALRTVDPVYVLLMGGGIFVFMVLRAFRWRFMLGPDVTWRTVFHIQNIGYMLNMTLPFRLGDVARAALIGNVPPVTLASGISTMVVERMLDMLFIVTLLPFTLSFVDGLPGWMQNGMRAFGVASIGGILVLIVAANQRPFARKVATAVLTRLPLPHPDAWVQRIDELLAGLSSLTHVKDALILIFWSIVLWLPIIFAYGVGMRAVGIELAPPLVAFVVCAAALSVALPSSPGQIGVFHAGVTAALTFIGQPEAPSAGFAIVYHAVNLGMMVLIGLIGLSSIGATYRNVVEAAQRLRRRTPPKAAESIDVAVQEPAAPERPLQE